MLSIWLEGISGPPSEAEQAELREWLAQVNAIYGYDQAYMTIKPAAIEPQVPHFSVNVFSAGEPQIEAVKKETAPINYVAHMWDGVGGESGDQIAKDLTERLLNAITDWFLSRARMIEPLHILRGHKGLDGIVGGMTRAVSDTYYEHNINPVVDRLGVGPIIYGRKLANGHAIDHAMVMARHMWHMGKAFANSYPQFELFDCQTRDRFNFGVREYMDQAGREENNRGYNIVDFGWWEKSMMFVLIPRPTLTNTMSFNQKGVLALFAGSERPLFVASKAFVDSMVQLFPMTFMHSNPKEHQSGATFTELLS